MAHVTTREAEAILDQEVKILDKGFVRLVDYSGNDARVVAAARTSYGAGTKTVREDQGLINYLMRNKHMSPFEQVSLTFHIKLPLFIFAQLVRHRTAKLNSMSARYSAMPDEFYLPGDDGWRGQSTLNKQIGDGALSQTVSSHSEELLAVSCKNAYHDYETMLSMDVSREQARMVLPQNLYTQIYWTCDLRNLLGFLKLRLDAHAQKEIRDYAEALATCAKAVAPMCYSAFEEFDLNAVNLSATNVQALQKSLLDYKLLKDVHNPELLALLKALNTEGYT